MGLQPGWATASLIGAAASVVVCLLLCLFMCVCYYPGGRKFSDVIAVHEISKYNPSGKEMDGDEDYDVESQSEYGTIAPAVEHKDQVRQVRKNDLNGEGVRLHWPDFLMVQAYGKISTFIFWPPE